MQNTSVTVVLIGEETSQRKYVNYEIARSYQDGKGLLGVYIHNLKCPRAGTCAQGNNPLDNWFVNGQGSRLPLSAFFKTYDYELDDGFNNLASWIEEAARIAGR